MKSGADLREASDSSLFPSVHKNDPLDTLTNLPHDSDRRLDLRPTTHCICVPHSDRSMLVVTIHTQQACRAVGHPLDLTNNVRTACYDRKDTQTPTVSCEGACNEMGISKIRDLIHPLRFHLALRSLEVWEPILEPGHDGRCGFDQGLDPEVPRKITELCEGRESSGVLGGCMGP
jgi:hypothetical protein